MKNKFYVIILLIPILLSCKSRKEKELSIIKNELILLDNEIRNPCDCFNFEDGTVVIEKINKKYKQKKNKDLIEILKKYKIERQNDIPKFMHLLYCQIKYTCNLKISNLDLKRFEIQLIYTSKLYKKHYRIIKLIFR